MFVRLNGSLFSNNKAQPEATGSRGPGTYTQ